MDKEYGAQYVTACGADGKTVSALCPCCGRVLSARSPLGIKKAAERLKGQLNKCGECGSYVCNDCFVVFDGKEMRSLCVRCAGEKGIIGVTTTQMSKKDI